MKPSQIAQELNHIASKIQHSKNPDRKLVARDLKRMLAALGDVQLGQPQTCSVQVQVVAQLNVDVACPPGYDPEESMPTPEMLREAEGMALEKMRAAGITNAEATAL